MQPPNKTTPFVSSLIPLLLVVGVLSLVAGCGFVSGSGNIVTRTPDLSGFTRVEVGDTCHVRVAQGTDFAVTIKLDDNLLQYLEARVDGDTLHIDLQSGKNYNDVTLEAVVTLPALQALELHGASSGRLSGFHVLEPIAIAVGGDSSLQLIDLRSAAADLQLSGSSALVGTWVLTDGRFELSGDSQVRLTGAADTLSLDVSGSSTCELARFRVRALQADLSGSSDGTVHVTDALDADLSGASTLEYLGDPTLGRIDTSGSSQVRPAEQ